MGAMNAELHLILFGGRLQLISNDAVYSDGDKYIPAVKVVSHLKKQLPSIKNVLVLGSGLGSIVYVMRKRGVDPHFTLVEQDKVVLKWAMELLDEENEDKVTPVCMDARAFMLQNANKYDLVFIDIFDGLFVPDFVCSKEFLVQCKSSLAPGGHIAFNYIANDDRKWEQVRSLFTEIFPGHKVINVSINKIFVC